MKMKMNVPDRLATLDVLPREANIITLKLMRVLKEELSLSEDEIKKVGLKIQPKGVVNFDPTVELSKEIEISDMMKGVIVQSLKTLNGEELLREAHINIYEKLIGEV